MHANGMCPRVKRRLADVGLPPRLSPHSFRLTVATDLLEQDVPLEELKCLLRDTDARATNLRRWRKRRVSRNSAERISI